KVEGDDGDFAAQVADAYKSATGSAGYSYIDSVIASLKRAGYQASNITVLKNDAASVANIYNALRKSPGVVIFDSHGGVIDTTHTGFLTGESLKGVGLKSRDEVT